MPTKPTLEQATAAVEAALRAAEGANVASTFAFAAARALHKALNTGLDLKSAIAEANEETQAHVIATQKAEEAICKAVRLCNELANP